MNEDGTTGITSTNRFGIIKLYNGSACNWWLRSAYSLYEDTFYAVRVDGTLQGNFMVNNEFGVSPAFRLGN